MQILRVLRYGFSGGQTIQLETKMKNFVPMSEHQIHDRLTQLYAMREYLPFHTPTFTAFVSSLEGHYVRQRQFDRKSLRVYQMMQKMQMMTDNTKRIFHQSICRYLANQKTQENIKNERLEHLLWWLYREFPYQFGRFQEIASNYTVRLYDIFQYMNMIDRLPTWEPYIRVSHMLKSLGHDLQCRTDMFQLQTLQKIDRKYFIYLLQLFTPEMYTDFVKSLKIQTSLPEFLCENFIIGDQIDYDKYLQRIEVIDNISANEQINCTMDSISWKDMAEGWKLAAHAYSERGLTDIHQHKFTEIFWRKLETSDIPAEEIATLLKILIDHPTLFFEKRQSIIMRIVESLYQKNDQEIQFFAPKGYIQLLKLIDYLPMDGSSIKKLSHFLYQKIQALINWAEGDAHEMLQLIEKKDFPQKDKIIELLNKKISSDK